MGVARKEMSTVPGLQGLPGSDVPIKTAHAFMEGRRKLDGAEGLWRIRNNLYDLEGFAKYHPGGEEWIRLTRGTDITEVFESHHLTDKAEKMLPKFFVREASSPRSIPLTFEPNGFFNTFKKRALEALKDVDFHRPSRKSNLIADIVVTATIALCMASASRQSYIVAIFAGIFLAWTTIIGHNYFHMRDNFRMYYFDLATLSSKEWRITHVLSHHTYPNTVWDYEVYAAEPFLQWLTHKSKTAVLSFCSKMFSPLYWSLAFFEQGLKRYYSICFEHGETDFRDVIPLFIPLTMIFFGSSFATSLKLWAVIIMTASFWFTMVGFNAAHHHPDIFHDGDVYRNDMDWGLLELDAVREREVVDDSNLLVLTNFGLHALHHLLPTVDHCYLPFCQKAYEQTCKEFGVWKPKFTQWELMRGQFKQLGRTEAKRNQR